MFRFVTFLLFTGIALSGLGCNATDEFDKIPETEDPCTYKEISGIATVIAIDSIDDTSVSFCPTPKEVKFSFTADVTMESSMPDCGRMTCLPDNQVSGEFIKVLFGQQDPPEQWLVEQGITVGSQHNVIKREITSGTCTPVQYTFLDLDFDRAAAICSGN